MKQDAPSDSTPPADNDHVHEVEHVWIPMPDGCQLSAKLWLTADADQHPVPAILEYIPYRKRDNKAIRDAQIHAFFAEHGYVGVRVDLRGSGDSEGVLRDEYLPQEMDDLCEVLRWLEQQPWCNGKVGLFGLSWGGFNGLQLAARRPPQLGAVVTVSSSDDRYADDVHYMGGCLLTDNLSWASTMFAFNSCPPDPAIVGEKWKAMWLERLEHSGLWLKTWLEHQRRDAFWKHGSVCENYDDIEVPVLAVSGWADGYTNTVFRLLANLKSPCRGLVGAWGHKYPHSAGPGQSIDFLGQCLRWWDRWLKDIDNGVEKDPALTAWMQDTTSPLTPSRPGRWIAEERWPSPRVVEKPWRLTYGQMLEENGEPAPEPQGDDKSSPNTLTIQSPLGVGMFAGKWCSYSEATDLPWDQRPEDGGSLIFDTPPLAEDIEILGRPIVRLTLSADKPDAMVAVRLSDVSPSDRSTRVTFGVLNLAHRDSHEHPEPLEPGKRYTVEVPMNHIAQRFPMGHRVRLAISSSYWPLTWPSPEAFRLRIWPGESGLTLPVRAVDPDTEPDIDMGEPRHAPEPPTTMLAPPRREWTVNHDLARNRVSLNIVNDDPSQRFEDIDLTIGRKVRESYSHRFNNYDTVRGEVEGQRFFSRGDWKVRTFTRTVLTSTRTHFLIRATLDAYEDEVRVFAKSWDEKIPRDHM
ncbi:MAG: CocE/NonD family hydrolase [Phycisphaeraceae bacterium]